MGPMLSWFPLSESRLHYYDFRLNGEEHYGDYDVFRINFEGHGEDDDCWKGEALIEKNDFWLDRDGTCDTQTLLLTA